jgi:hypothetical protein
MGDGTIQVWRPAELTRAGAAVPLCDINIEVPVSGIGLGGEDTFVLATPNGLTAIRVGTGWPGRHRTGGRDARSS